MYLTFLGMIPALISRYTCSGYVLHFSWYFLCGCLIQLVLLYAITKWISSQLNSCFVGILDWTRDVTLNHVKRRWVTAWMKQLGWRLNRLPVLLTVIYTHTSLATALSLYIYHSSLPYVVYSLRGDDCYASCYKFGIFILVITNIIMHCLNLMNEALQQLEWKPILGMNILTSPGLPGMHC